MLGRQAVTVGMLAYAVASKTNRILVLAEVLAMTPPGAPPPDGRP
jgi:hypothetical protein